MNATSLRILRDAITEAVDKQALSQADITEMTQLIYVITEDPEMYRATSVAVHSMAGAVRCIRRKGGE